VTFANGRRGLRIAKTGFQYLNEGAYGVIFVDRAAARIVKVYKRREEEAHARAVFDAEAEAYKRALAVPAVAELVPGGFRPRPVHHVVDKHGNDVTSEFFPDLAFETDFVPGEFRKIGLVDSVEAARVRRLFHEAGIEHTLDMSVTLETDGRIVKAIDFAMTEHVLYQRSS
jgi:hypothetical protein